MDQTMNIEAIQALLDEELKELDTLLEKEIQCEVPLAVAVMQYALSSGGKRFRPLLLLLVCKACGYEGRFAPTAALFIEFIHNATLLHDDVVDDSAIRRGMPAARIQFSNAASVLVGDFLYTRAFQLMVRCQCPPLLEVMADATNLIAAGEVMQLSNMYNADVDEKRYYRVIELKTAVLFAAATECAALLSRQDAAVVNNMREYGKHLGMAFQIIDDVLDYMGDAEVIGKSLGDDLAEGKPTLPLIRCMRQLPDDKRKRMREIIEEGEREAIDEVIALIKETDALQSSMQAAKDLAIEAVVMLDVLPDTPYRQALQALAELVVKRNQ